MQNLIIHIVSKVYETLISFKKLSQELSAVFLLVLNIMIRQIYEFTC